MSSLLRPLSIVLALLLYSKSAHAQYDEWQASASFFVLTDVHGANLEASEEVHDFPLLVRLYGDTFDFQSAHPTGADIRFADAQGQPLKYQIDHWDAVAEEAAVWVRVPKIQGNERQELRIYWGNSSASDESSGSKVFARDNGFVSVWHLGQEIEDEVGSLPSQTVGTQVTRGMIGLARHLAGNEGVFGGEEITNYPFGGDAHSTEAWFRSESTNSTLIGWGNEGGGRGSKVRMQLRSPPHIHIDSDFSDVDAPHPVELNRWTHVVHTYANGQGRIYLNGQLAGSAEPQLEIKRPSRLWLGGWYHHYDFVGDLDEVRVSQVARSATWIKLQYENQKPHQTLVGWPVKFGNQFELSAQRVSVNENESVTINATSQGAQKLYWLLRVEGVDSIVAVDRSSYEFQAPRIVTDQSATLICRAVYADEVREAQVDLILNNSLAEPIVSLAEGSPWNGRQTIALVATINNQDELIRQSANELEFVWQVAGLATIHQASGEKLTLQRAMNRGELTVIVRVNNGGAWSTASTTIQVTEPQKQVEPRIARQLEDQEEPSDHQFFARNERNVGELVYRGRLEDEADEVFLRVYADSAGEDADNDAAVNQPVLSLTDQVSDDGRYSLIAELKPGLIRYRAEFGSIHDGVETIRHQAENLVCGDVYLIIGQSNAVATDFGETDDTVSSDWIRTFGATDGSPNGSRRELWANAVARAPGGVSEIGYWGMKLGERLVSSQQIPICILNGAVGGTRIDQHQRNESDPTDVSTIYGRLLWRVQQAKLTHGVRAILWHQGENDQGADGPTGGFGWETYRELFITLAGRWKLDYPNVESFYVFQIWPKSCSMGIDGSDNRLREVQRTLPRYFSNLQVMSTLGIKPEGGCHFPAKGYAEFARLIEPLILQNQYGQSFNQPITPANLQRAYFADESRESLVLEFDQPVVWNPELATEFRFDGKRGSIVAGEAVGNQLTLRLEHPSSAKRITYLDSERWNSNQLLYGENGIAALTFCEVEIELVPTRE